eukprot:2020429-Alexandrium_andersonii.AAC.1
MSASLVGSEMCIRDRGPPPPSRVGAVGAALVCWHVAPPRALGVPRVGVCLLYTSDAADDM